MWDGLGIQLVQRWGLTPVYLLAGLMESRHASAASIEQVALSVVSGY